jgi:hypothetical protein
MYDRWYQSKTRDDLTAISGPQKLHVDIPTNMHYQTICEEHDNHTKPALTRGK